MPRLNRSPEDLELAEAHGRDFLEILARGLRVLAAFGQERARLTISDVAQLVGLNRAAARRILFTLERLGYLESDGRTFRLTPRVLTFAQSYLSSSVVPAVMQPIVERISAQAGENCSAAVLHDLDVVFVARATPVRIVSIGLEVGYRIPAHFTAVGRVLLGELADDVLDGRLARIDPRPATDRTIVDKVRLREAILAARRQGYALVSEEAEQGFASIAVPVHRHDGSAACAIHVGVHVDRVPPARMLDEFLPLLQAGAAEARTMLV